MQVDKRLGPTLSHWRSDWLILDERHFGFTQSVFVVGETFKNVFGKTMLHVVASLMATLSVFVLAKVVSIRDKLFYPCCTRCHQKIHTRDNDEAM